MKSEDIAEMLKGKTIDHVEHGAYLRWSMTLDAIHFTDGTVLELCGAADYAFVDHVLSPDGTAVRPEEAK